MLFAESYISLRSISPICNNRSLVFRQLRANGFTLKRKELDHQKQQRSGVTNLVIKILEENAVCAVAQDWQQDEGGEKGMDRHDARMTRVKSVRRLEASAKEDQASCAFVPNFAARLGNPVSRILTSEAPYMYSFIK